MTTFVVLFLCLCALLLILAPLTLSLSREVREASDNLREMQHEMARVLAQLERFRITSERASDGIILQDMSGRILWCNSAYSEIHRRPKDDIIGKNPLDFALPERLQLTKEERAAHDFEITDGTVQRFINRRATGEEFWIELSSSFHCGRDGRKYAIVVCRDITERVDQETQLQKMTAELEHEATHDHLTGVPNRAAFLTFVEKVIADGQAASLGLLHIDLDHFKEINDTYGHRAGDTVLRKTAAAIQGAIRKSDLVARIGGDEFVVVCAGSTDLRFLSEVAHRLHDAITQPVKAGDRTLTIEASIGAAQSSGPKCDGTKLLAQADFALYEAKASGRNAVALYDATLHKRHSAEIEMGRALVEAVDTDALDYVFQPFLDLHTGEIAGFETLVRWTHPDHGFLPPEQFLPLAETLGLMGQLDMLSMTAALQKKKELDEMGYDYIGVTFNASPQLLSHPEFINRLVWGVEISGIPRRDITIEILENTDFGDLSAETSHANLISDLARAGFHVHLDDFGVGFAGLSHLASLNITGVKIDRSLITNVLTDEVSLKIVRKIIELSQDLGLRVIAEGVEDKVTADVLRDMGCSLIQGYWLSKPLPADQVMDWLAQRGDDMSTRSA